MKLNDVMSFVSPGSNPVNTHCAKLSADLIYPFLQMHFSLYLSGDFNGSLEVTVVENGTSSTTLIWEKHDQWTNNWEDVDVQLDELHNV